MSSKNPESLVRTFPTVFEMKAYFDESMNIALAMSAVALAIIVYSDKFDNKISIRVAGFGLIVTATSVPVIFSIEFLKYVKKVKEEQLPSVVSTTHLYLYIALCYTYFILMIIIAFMFAKRKILNRK